jgi:hypothetical protein
MKWSYNGFAVVSRGVVVRQPTIGTLERLEVEGDLDPRAQHVRVHLLDLLRDEVARRERSDLVPVVAGLAAEADAVHEY